MVVTSDACTQHTTVMIPVLNTPLTRVAMSHIGHTPYVAYTTVLLYYALLIMLRAIACKFIERQRVCISHSAGASCCTCYMIGTVMLCFLYSDMTYDGLKWLLLLYS